MKLLIHEEEILTANDNKIILTNQRIQMNEKDWGSAYSITIFLEDISSIEIRYNSVITFLILGGVALLVCILALVSSNAYSNNQGYVLISLAAALFFFFLYWLSKKHVISVCPNGGKPLNFEITQMKEEQIQDFFNKLQAAKGKRMQELHKI